MKTADATRRELAGWQLETLIARGGGGEVWLARHPEDATARHVAKIANADVAVDVGRLRAEARLLLDIPCAALPDVAAWLPPGNDGVAALILERRAGTTLDLALAGASLAALAAVGEAALAGLRAVHAAGIVHGDLHPRNILLAADGRVSLLDLGLAAAVGTTTVVGPGRPEFAAPERLAGEGVDPRDDLFSLAMTLWLSFGIPQPFADYPAILPTERDRPTLPERHPADVLLRVLAGWLHPRRSLRPPHAEAALREWRAAAGDLLSGGHAGDGGFASLRGRAWRADLAPGAGVDGARGPTGDAIIEGGAGSGRTGVLRGALLRHGGPVAWLRGRDGRHALARCEAEAARFGSPTGGASAGSDEGTTVEGALGGRGAAAQARVDARIRAVAAALGSAGLLLVDDLELLPGGVAEAVLGVVEGAVEGRCRVLISATHAPPVVEARVIPVTAATVEEVQRFVETADGGRAWDLSLIEAIAAAVGPQRARVFPLVAALGRGGHVDRAVDRVELAAAALAEDGLAATVRAALAGLEQPPAPPPALWPLLAHLLVDPSGLRGHTADPAPSVDHALLRAWPWLSLRAAGGHWLDPLAATTALAATATGLRATAAQDRATFYDGVAGGEGRALELRLSAASLGAPLTVAPAAVALRVDALAAAGDAHAALVLIDNWRAAGAPLDAAVLAAGVRAATAQGRFSSVDALVADASEAAREAVDPRLAVSEAAFRRGTFGLARTQADAALSQLGVRTDRLGDWPRPAAVALVLRAFAATWQGDLDAARADIGIGRTVTSPWPELRAQIDYLDGLCHYYAGELEVARRSFEALVAEGVALAVTAAAWAGLGLCAQRGGDLAAARRAYDESRRIAEHAGDRARVLNMTMNLATLDHEAGDLGLALDGYNRVVVVAMRLGNDGARVRALVNRGNLHWGLGLVDEAQSDLEAALPELERTGNAYLEGNVTCVMAELARASGRLQQAQQWISRAHDALAAVGAENELAEIRIESAWLSVARGELVQARSLAEQVEGAAAALQSEELAARALHVRARVAWLDALADAATPREASRHLDAALGLLADAAGRMPPQKALAAVRIDADRAWLLAATGRRNDAKVLASSASQRLDRVAATLPTHVRQRFVAAAVFTGQRDILGLCVRLAERAESTGGDASIGRAAHYAVMAINQRLSAEHDLDRLLETLMDSAVTLTGAERGFLLLDRREGNSTIPPQPSDVDVAVARNLDGENLRKPGHKLSHSIAVEVFETGEPVLATDAQLDPRFSAQDSVHSGNLRSILCVPLILRGRTIGVLYADNRFAAGAFSREHAAILEALASQAAIAIHTARLIARLRQREVELEGSRAEVVGLNARLEAELASTEDALTETRRQLLSERGEAARRSDYENIRGDSAQLHDLFRVIDRVRDHDFPVLIVGESGTGKELVARALHFTGRRKSAPFVAINCGALPESLLESELFGHVRGAFTGAVGDRRGLFEQAHGGTLFLDEIGEMPPAMQVKLLRVLQSGELTRVGGSGQRKVDVRVVAATHRDLDRMVREGEFREDLLYRLRVVDLHVPPLRERASDLELLTDYFLAANRAAGLGAVRRITKGALRRMRSYSWPGNVRELETFLKSACLFVDSDTLDVADVLPLLERAEGKAARRSGNHAIPTAGVPSEGTLQDVERLVVLARLAALGGNKRRTAESLGIDRGTLYNKLRGWGEMEGDT